MTMETETMETTEAIEPTQTPPRVWDYVFHAETSNGYLIVKIDAESKDEAIKLAMEEFTEWGTEIWTPDMPVYLGKFSYELNEDNTITTERGEVVDFSSIQ
jgi:hypothetical protein